MIKATIKLAESYTAYSPKCVLLFSTIFFKEN